LRANGFEWAWKNVSLAERVTLPANGRYPDASFDGFLIRGTRALSYKAFPIQAISDHFPAIPATATQYGMKKALLRYTGCSGAFPNKRERLLRPLCSW
jgi:hypothetical protein